MKKSNDFIKKSAIIFILLFCSILFALLLGELAVRKLNILDRKFDHIFSRVNSFVTPSDDERIKYVLIPNFKDKIKSRRGETGNPTYSINSLGLRGPEPGRKKGSIDIVIIGDSISFGLGVEDDYIYPVVLEKKLNSWAKKKNVPLDFEVYNCSVPGYNSTQEYFFCKDFIEAIRPKIVILQYFFNDFWPPMQYAMGNLIWNFEQRFPSHLLFLLNALLREDKFFDESNKEGVAASLSSVRSMAEMTSSIDAKFITFIAPAVSEIDDLDNLRRKTFDFVSFLKRTSSEYIDIMAVFDGYTSKDIRVRAKDDHWNRRGHELVADKLAKWVIKDMERERYNGGLEGSR